MSEHDEPEAVETEDEVEAHGLKEIAVTGLSAAALIAGAGDAIAATTPGHASATSKQAVHKIDAAQKGAAFTRTRRGRARLSRRTATDPTLEARDRSDVEARDRSDVEARDRSDVEARNRSDVEAGRPGRDLSP